MEPHLTIDVESFSRIDLKRCGLYRYAEDESTDLLCVCWAVDDGNIQTWIPSGPDDICPTVLAHHIKSGAEVRAWNANFERAVLNGTAGQRYDFPKIEIAQTYCSMVNARVHGLPGGLDACSRAVNSPRRKSRVGVNAMQYLCKPRKDGTRPTLEEESERFKQLAEYCAEDVYAERELDRLIPRMSDAELRIYREIDAPMNDHGWKVDLKSADNMEILISVYKKELESRCLSVTGIKPSQAGKLADWIRANGCPELEDLQADTVRKILMLGPPEKPSAILRLFSTFNAKAVMKYAKMREAACADGRVRGMFLFYGAGTGRWSSTIVQLQNLYRSVIADPEIAIEAAREWDLDWIRTLYPGVDPMKVIASCVRSCLTADNGKELLFPDYSGVEARWNAWMWNELWKLESFRRQDAGTGPSSYCVVYGECFNEDPSFDTSTSEGSFKKQLGKVLDLSMGYEGGVGAFVKMAGTYRIDLAYMVERAYPTLRQDVLEEALHNYEYAREQGRLYDLPEKVWITCESLKILWRRAHPGIVAGWASLKETAIRAVSNPGRIFETDNQRIKFKTEGDFLIMRLPSGRKIFYYKPQIRDDTLHYQGMNTSTRIWGPTLTYGGRICENETQAGCRDILVYAKFKLKAMGLPIVGTVHDEIVMEVDEGWHGEEEVRTAMCTNPDWCVGMPLAVEMHRGKRYRK